MNLEPMIEPDRILEGLAKTLESVVLPALPAGYARGQLHAVLEVLGSLHGQLLVGGPMLENEAAMLESLAGEAARKLDATSGELGARCRNFATRPFATLGERLAEGRALVCALIDGGHADEGPLQEAVNGYLANDSILKAMALRPGRLAEISEG